MPKKDDQTIERLRANYERASLLVPPELKGEFRKTILPIREFLSYAPLLDVAKEMKSSVIPSFIQNTIQLRFSVNRFGRRLVLAGGDPTAVYTELVRNLSL